MSGYRGYPGKLKSDFATLKRMGIPGGDGFRGKGATHSVDGLGQADWRCVKCGTTNKAPVATAGSITAPCRKCRRLQTQERVR